MLTNLKRKAEGLALSNSKGFTIIEVLIVLAIAGLILLIVFLAVPALQRNSRNTQRRNEVGTILAAVNEYVANNNGKVPTEFTDGKFKGDGDTTSSVTPKLSFYKDKLTYAEALPGGDLTPSEDSVTVYASAKCQDNKPVSSGSRSIAAFFGVEPSSPGDPPVAQCVDG